MPWYSFLWCSILLAVVQGQNDPDPCFNYKFLHDKDKRYVSYQADVDNGETEICDQYMIPIGGEWYYSDNDMPVEAPPLFRCGTAFPIWLSGSIPVPADGIVERTACRSGSCSACYETYIIKIKVCAGYSVYFLQPTTGCPIAYCFGVGTYDDPPTNKTQTPVVKYHLVQVETRPGVFQDRLEFECYIGESKDLSYKFYQVNWIKDGLSVYTVTAQKKNMRDLRLTEDRTKPSNFNSLGVTLSCIARPKNAIDGRPGNSSRSDNFYAGINVKQTSLLLPRDNSTTLELSITVPFGCGWRDQNTWTPCDLYVQMYVPENSGTCTGEPTANEHGKNCAMTIGVGDWDKPHTITLSYKDRGQYYLGFPNTFILTLVTMNSFHPVWNGYTLPSVQVNVYDNNLSWQGKTCSSQNDPHMTTFDGRKYENHNSGSFTLYQHSDNNRPMEVQIKLSTCNRAGLYCNCGAALRAGGDVYVIDFCDQNRIMQYMTCHDKILDVRRYNKNKNVYNIFFPTGTEVEINLYYSTHYTQYNLNVKVRASMHDTDNTKGLCGLLSGTCTDDFVLRDSSYSTVPGAKDKCRGQRFYDLYPNDFSKSWRVFGEENLFELTENQQIGLWNDANRYCTCPKLSATPPFDFECVPGSVNTCERDKNYNPIGTTMCQVLSKKRSTSISYPWKSFHQRRKKRASDQIQQYNIVMTPEEALTYCQNTIGNTTAFAACSSVPNVPKEETLEICAMDIALTNSTDWVEETLETLKSGCLTELLKNNTLQETDEDNGQSIAEEIEQMICPGLPECSGQGRCINGTCECDSGYIEVDCSVHLSQPPKLFGIRGEGLCDINEISCNTAFLVGDGISYSKNMSCKVKDFVVFRNGLRYYTDEYIIDGVIETVIEMHCQVRSVSSFHKRDRQNENDVFIKGHVVSVSYDKENFGDGHEMFTYDSICQDPDSNAEPPTFSLLENTCFISGQCLMNGVYNDTNICLMCDSSNPYKWSTDSKNMVCVSSDVVPRDDNKSTLIIAIVVGVVGAALVVLIALFIIRKLKGHKSKKIVDSNQSNPGIPVGVDRAEIVVSQPPRQHI